MIQPRRTFSPYAPPALAGLPTFGNGAYKDVPRTYVFQYSNIGSNATVLDQSQIFDNGCDFYWRGLLATCDTAATPNANRLFALRFQDPYGVYLSDDFVGGFGISSMFSNQPFPMIPSVYCPAGSRILIDLQDQSGAGNSVLLNFIGVERYYL